VSSGESLSGPNDRSGHFGSLPNFETVGFDVGQIISGAFQQRESMGGGLDDCSSTFGSFPHANADLRTGRDWCRSAIQGNCGNSRGRRVFINGIYRDGDLHFVLLIFSEVTPSLAQVAEVNSARVQRPT
jgi:hypothetical protein